MAEQFKKNYKLTRFHKKSKDSSLSFPKIYVNLTIAQHSSIQRQQQLSQSAKEHSTNANSDAFSKFRCISTLKDFQHIPNRHAPLSYKLNYINTVPCRRITEKISDLFDNAKHKVILVEGMPGIGKTELVKEIALEWANGKILHDIKLLLLLYLRRPELCKLDSIDSFLKFISKDFLVDEQISCVSKQLKLSQGENVMFLMDGYDECVNKLQEDCFVMRLINREILCNSLVLITSRPSATYHLHNQADKITEIIGFAEKEQDLYISQALEKFPSKQDKFKSYMRENLSLKSYTFIPLYIAMLVSLLNEDCFPEILTEMIEKCVLYTVYKHLKTKTSDTEISLPMRFRTLQDLPRHVLKFVHQLSNLAFDGIRKNKLVFTLNDLKQACPDIEDILSGFGLLETIEHYPQDEIGDTSYSFNFLHYSIQEYLAAFYVSTLSDEEQYALMSSCEFEFYTTDPSSVNLDGCGVYIESCFWHSHYSHMWLMYSGITSGKSVAFKQFVHGIDSVNGKYRKSFDDRHNLLLFQHYLEAKNILFSNVLLDIFGKDTINLSDDLERALLPHHMFSLVHFLKRSSRTYKSLIFSKYTIPEDSLNILAQFFADFRSIQSICFKDNNLTSSSIKAIGDIIKINCLEEIKIAKNTMIFKTGITEIAAALAINNNIVSLSLSHNELSDTDLNLLLNSFSADSFIESLDISYNKGGSKGAQEVAMFLIHHKTLRILNLAYNGIALSKSHIPDLFELLYCDCEDDFINISSIMQEEEMPDCSGVVALAAALNYSSLAVIDLSGNMLNHYGLHHLAHAIEANTTLQLIHLSTNGLNPLEGTMIANAVRINKSIVSLNISDNEINDLGMYTFCTMLYFNTTLKQLDVSSNNLNVNSAIEIGQVLQHNYVLTTLALGSNYIGDLGSQHLAAALQVNQTITSLYVRDNMIGDVGAKAIAIALKRNVTLLQLDISFNNITDNGAIAVFDSLCTNSKLKTLFALLNPISSSVIERFLNLNPDVIVDQFCLHRNDIDVPLLGVQVVEHERYIIASQQTCCLEWRNNEIYMLQNIYESLIPKYQQGCLKYFLEKNFENELSDSDDSYEKNFENELSDSDDSY